MACHSDNEVNLTPVNPKTDTPADAHIAQTMLLSLTEGIRALTGSLDVMIQGARSDEDIQAISEVARQIGTTTDTIRAWSPLLLATEPPNAAHTVRYAMRKWSTSTWRSAYEVHQAVKRYDPRLHDIEIAEGIASLVADGWMKRSNIGGGRTQYRRTGE